MVNIPAVSPPGEGGINKLFLPKTDKQGKNKDSHWQKIAKNALFWQFSGVFLAKSV